MNKRYNKEDARKLLAVLEVLEREGIEADEVTIKYEMSLTTLVDTEPTQGVEGNDYYKTNVGYLVV